MTKIEFKRFYDDCIKIIAVRLIKEQEQYFFTDNLDAIYEEYMHQNVMLHMMYGKQNSLLDRHKICACVTVAIIKCHPLVNRDLQTDEAFSFGKLNDANEQLAFLASWELLKGFIVAKEKTDASTFVLPTTFHNCSFVDTVSRSLFMANQQNGLSSPLIANIYYLLEKYCADIKAG